MTEEASPGLGSRVVPGTETIGGGSQFAVDVGDVAVTRKTEKRQSVLT